MLFCSTNELRQSAVDSLEESRSPATTIKVPNFFQFKSEQISILLVFLVHITNNLWCTSYRHNYLVMCTIYALFTHVHPCNQRGHYQPQQWLEWLLSHVLHLYFYLHVTAKNNVMFLLSVECRFQRYQGWPELTKSNGEWHTFSNWNQSEDLGDSTRHEEPRFGGWEVRRVSRNAALTWLSGLRY